MCQTSFTLLAEQVIMVLLVAALIYFLMDDMADGIFLALVLMRVAAISRCQQSGTWIALKKLMEFAQPGCKVIRDGKV